MVRIDNFEAVPCEYRRGPSYLFTEEDGQDFEDCWRRWTPSSSPAAMRWVIFAADTRGLSLEAEDRELLDQFFPGPAMVALLIQPYATRSECRGVFSFANTEISGEESAGVSFGGASCWAKRLRRDVRWGRWKSGRRPRAVEENTEVVFGFSEPAREVADCRTDSRLAQRLGVAAYILVPVAGSGAGVSAGADDRCSRGSGGGAGFVAVLIRETK